MHTSERANNFLFIAQLKANIYTVYRVCRGYSPTLSLKIFTRGSYYFILYQLKVIASLFFEILNYII